MMTIERAIHFNSLKYFTALTGLNQLDDKLFIYFHVH
jgi:hypothetical protein